MSTLSPQTHVSFGIFELAELFDSADAALVVMKLRAWLAYNQVNNPDISYRDDRWWTFRSIKKWCQHDFKWLTPRQLGTIMEKLEGLKVITRRQYGADELKMAYWYTVNEDVLAELIKGMKSANAFDAEVKCSNTQVKSFDTGVKYKTTEKENKIKRKHTKTQTTTSRAPAHDDTEADAAGREPAVVVVTPPCPTTKQAESGEHSINGEVSQNRKDEVHEGSFAFEDPISQHANDTAIPPVPLTPLTPVAADELRADLIRFGVLPFAANRLIKQHGETDTRYMLSYVKEQGKLGPGFIVEELDTRKWGVLARRDDGKKITFNQPSPISPPLTEDRIAEMQRETARMMGEDLEPLNTFNQQSANHPDVGVDQMLHSIPSLEFA